MFCDIKVINPRMTARRQLCKEAVVSSYKRVRNS